jgi:hypothetical protein
MVRWRLLWEGNWPAVCVTRTPEVWPGLMRPRFLRPSVMNCVDIWWSADGLMRPSDTHNYAASNDQARYANN